MEPKSVNWPRTLTIRGTQFETFQVERSDKHSHEKIGNDICMENKTDGLVRVAISQEEWKEGGSNSCCLRIEESKRNFCSSMGFFESRSMFKGIESNKA